MFLSCGHQEGDYGATVGDCDQICTVYHVAQLKLAEDYEIYDRDFPDKEVRRMHVKKTVGGHRIESWFRLVGKGKDTTNYNFSCEVIEDMVSLFGYGVINMNVSPEPSSLIVEYADGQFVNCDTASGYLEVSMCTLRQLENKRKELDSIYESVLELIDKSAIENDSTYIPGATDYHKLKQDIIESQRLFLQYLELEMSITGESVGIGHARPIYENARGIELIEERVKSLKLLIEGQD
jgi:hypothetical protein